MQEEYPGSIGASSGSCGVGPLLRFRIANGSVDPALSRVFEFEEVGKAHQLIFDNQHPPAGIENAIGLLFASISNMSWSMKLHLTNGVTFFK